MVCEEIPHCVRNDGREERQGAAGKNGRERQGTAGNGRERQGTAGNGREQRGTGGERRETAGKRKRPTPTAFPVHNPPNKSGGNASKQKYATFAANYAQNIVKR
ncbi:MAG: hypothetical protein LBO71_00795 [Prevotellaceae bacterium]|nr:hypothetical protein [Prevotellaceae bacterium]